MDDLVDYTLERLEEAGLKGSKSDGITRVSSEKDEIASMIQDEESLTLLYSNHSYIDGDPLGGLFRELDLGKTGDFYVDDGIFNFEKEINSEEDVEYAVEVIEKVEDYFSELRIH